MIQNILALNVVYLLIIVKHSIPKNFWNVDQRVTFRFLDLRKYLTWI